MVLAVEIGSCFGALEYWSIGVLAKAKARIQLKLVLSLLHYSSRLPDEGRTIQARSVGGSKRLRARIFTIENLAPIVLEKLENDQSGTKH